MRQTKKDRQTDRQSNRQDMLSENFSHFKTDLPCDDLPCVAPPADQPTSEA